MQQGVPNSAQTAEMMAKLLAGLRLLNLVCSLRSSNLSLEFALEAVSVKSRQAASAEAGSVRFRD